MTDAGLDGPRTEPGALVQDACFPPGSPAMHRGGGQMTDQSPLTIPDMLRASAEKFRTRTALWQRSGSRSEPETRTYEQVLAQARQFAAGLLALGLRRGDHVAIIAENSIDWSLSFLGISLAGGVAVPIYYRLAEDEQAMLMRLADVRFACVGPGAEDRAPGGLRHVEHLILLGETVRRQEREHGLRALLRTVHSREPLTLQEVSARGSSAHAVERVTVLPDDLATLLFTSGTTGTPKAVMLSHRNILSNVWAVKEVIHVNEEDRLLLVLPMHHPFPLTLGLVLPLAIGALVAYENDLRRVRERMAEVQPTVFFGVPELYRLLLRAIFQRAEAEGQAARLRTALRISGWVKRVTGVNVGPLLFRSLHRRLGGRIRFLASGGAALPPELARQYYRMGLLLVQGWGLSETAPVLTVQEIDVKKFLFTRHYERLAGTVGRPIPGVRLRLLDVPEKEVLASRGEGELAAQGPNVMLGYYKDPAATAAVFFEDESGRWFRTGDLGRITPDGYVYLTGRVKSVIVLDTGEKVAPDEVEDVLRESPYILDVAVIGRQPDKYVGAGKVEVHAVIYPSYEELRRRAEVEGVPLTAERAHQWVTEEVKRLQQQRLAPYKWVRQVILTDQPLPKTPLGKVRRGLLMEHYAFDLERFVASSGAGQAA
jgi:long-chain acyl-CoA synthetase